MTFNVVKMEDTKVQIFQIINDAIHLDSTGDIEKAYQKYLQSILAIGKYLMEQFNSIGFPYEVENCQNSQKILIVGRQCWERLDDLLHNNKGRKTEKKKQDSVHPPEASISSHPLENSLDKTDSSCSNESALTSITFNSFALNDSNTSELQTLFTPRPQVTPLEKCKLENAKLRKTFQSRIMHAKNPMVKANLSLEYHRQIADNISIAKAKEREYLIEQQKREKKALHQATKILSQSRQVKLTELESEKCQLYASILQYEESESWTKNLRIRLASHPREQALIEEIAKTTLKRIDHPLVIWLLRKQNSVRETCTYLIESHKQSLSREQISKTNDDVRKLNESENLCHRTVEVKPGVQHMTKSVIPHNPISKRTNVENNLKPFLEETVNNTCNICDTCMLMLGLMYEKLNESEIAQDICHRVVEDIVLEPVWQHLVSLFRLHNMQSEYKISQTMKGFAECSPEDFGLKIHVTSKSFSYDECASKLKGILSITSPVQKLQSLVQAIQKFCEFQRIGEDGSPLTPTLLGADDLIPMLSYILVQTRQPSLLSECQALEQLLDQRYLLGEEGYCLTSCQMAFKYLEVQADKVDS